MNLPLLAADCSRCAALCCVLAPFRAGTGFGADKPSGTPCLNLTPADRCAIHDRLRESGWPGCVAFDCFGAGQQITQVTYAGRSWRDADIDRGEMAAVFSVMRMLHEALFHLQEAERRDGAPEVGRRLSEVAALVDLGSDDLLALDVEHVMGEVLDVLRAASRRVREAHAANGSPGADHHRAMLIAADLRGVDLGYADLLGADVRDADVRGADLGRVLYLSQAQVNGMRGDAATVLPDRLTAPDHWR